MARYAAIPGAPPVAAALGGLGIASAVLVSGAGEDLAHGIAGTAPSSGQLKTGFGLVPGNGSFENVDGFPRLGRSGNGLNVRFGGALVGSLPRDVPLGDLDDLRGSVFPVVTSPALLDDLCHDGLEEFVDEELALSCVGQIARPCLPRLPCPWTGRRQRRVPPCGNRPEPPEAPFGLLQHTQPLMGVRVQAVGV